jgi:hypothetical protein
MPTFNIDSDRTVMIATGKVAPVFEYVEGGPRGADRPVKRDPNTGFPLWLVDCLVDDDAARSTVAGVEVPSVDAPVVQKLREIKFRGLVVSCYVNRSTSALSVRWSAEGIEGARPQAVAS